jgi:CDGSH-type Zn-finger protein
MSGTPDIGGTKPIRVAVEAGQSYWWCACGKSQNQPFCDGSHKGSEFSPLEFKAETSEVMVLCTCKRTGTRPACDGSHKRL